MQNHWKQIRERFLVDNGSLVLKYRYLLVVKLKANIYYKKLLYYLFSYIGF